MEVLLLINLEEEPSQFIWGWLKLLNRLGSENEQLQINPLFLLISKQVIPSYFIRFRIEITHNHSYKQIEKEGKSKHHEYYVENDPDSAPPKGWMHINITGCKRVDYHLCPTISGTH